MNNKPLTKVDAAKKAASEYKEFQNLIKIYITHIINAVKENNHGFLQFLINHEHRKKYEERYEELHFLGDAEHPNLLFLACAHKCDKITFEIIFSLENPKNEIYMALHRKDHYRRTPFHFAVKCLNTRIIELFLAKGAELDVKDLNGNTPLYYAITSRNIEVAKLLISKGAKLYDMSINGVKKQFISILCEYGHVDIAISLLLKYEVRFFSVDGKHNLNPDFKYALEFYYSTSNTSFIYQYLQPSVVIDKRYLFLPFEEIINLLHLEHKFKKDDLEKLLEIARARDIIRKILLDKFLEANDPRILAGAAITHGMHGVLSYLFENGFTQSTIDHGYTLLYAAIENGKHPEIVEYLILNGADPTIIFKGYTALNYAKTFEERIKERQSIIDILTKYSFEHTQIETSFFIWLQIMDEFQVYQVIDWISMTDFLTLL